MIWSHQALQAESIFNHFDVDPFITYSPAAASRGLRRGGGPAAPEATAGDLRDQGTSPRTWHAPPAVGLRVAQVLPGRQGETGRTHPHRHRRRSYGRIYHWRGEGGRRRRTRPVQRGEGQWQRPEEEGQQQPRQLLRRQPRRSCTQKHRG